jgi:hypothetical protein
MQSDLYRMCSSWLYQFRKERIEKYQGREPEMEAKGSIGADAVCESLTKGEREWRATWGPQNLHVPETLNRVMNPDRLLGRRARLS